MERLPKSTTRTHGSPGGILKRDDLEPGDRMSLDQYVLKVKGRPLESACNEDLKYNGGTIFVDHASSRIFLHHQISLRAGETLIGKRLVEREAAAIGRKIKS